MKKTLIALLTAAGLIVSLSACDTGDTTREKDAALSKTAYQQQVAAEPYPAAQLKNSLERGNLARRLLEENKKNAIRYIYLLGDTGTYIGYYTIKGKVSSNQSQMQPQDDLEHPCSGCDRYVVDGPGDDGSYGEDAEGQFFFTTEGVYVTTDMRYIVSSQPLPVNAPKMNQPK